MANYFEMARTNYFNVKDVKAFEDYINLFSGIDLSKNKDGQIALFFDEEQGMPYYYYDENGEEAEVDFISDVSKHLTDESVFILQAIGNEKMRYLNGYAVAVDSKNERIDLSLNDIYEIARKKFDSKKVTLAEY